MKCRVAKRDLEAALNVVKHTKDDSASNISSHYVFRQSGPGVLELLSYNGRVFSSCPAPAAFEGEAKSFTIEAKRIGLFMEALPEDAVIDFIYEGKGEVIASVPRGKNLFATLDPELFPYWDDSIKKASKTATLSADRLSDALSHAGMFVYDQEQKQPQLCIVEFNEGNLFSTDTMAVSVVKVAGMEKSKMRVFGADVKHLTTFLASFKAKPTVPEADLAKVAKSDDEKAEKKAKVKAVDPEVEVFEGDKALFLKRPDGAVFGESRFDKQFPKITVEWESEDDYWVEIKKTEVESAIKFLLSGAKFDDSTIFFDLQPSLVRLSMKSSANAKMMTLDLPIEAQGQKDGDLPEMPKGGFPFSNVYLHRLMTTCSGDVVKLLISKKTKGGWIRVRDTRGEEKDTFFTTVAWLKSA